MCGYISLYYNDLFKDIQNENLKVVEIGSWLGGSLLLREKYFINSEIIGIDPNPEHNLLMPIFEIDDYKESNISFEEYLKTSKKIKFFKKDAYDLEFIKNTFEDNSIDILLDDGPHTYHYQKIVIDCYYSKIKKGGLLIIEDVIKNDINNLLDYYKSNYPNSKATLSFNNSPWDSELFNIITIVK
jgi:predicted O-methyltransferase YrrM